MKKKFYLKKIENKEKINKKLLKKKLKIRERKFPMCFVNSQTSEKIG